MQPQHPRRPHRRRDGPQAQAHRAARHAEPQRQRLGDTSPRSSSRASSASCSSRAACATRTAARAAAPAATSASKEPKAPPGRARLQHLARAGAGAALPREPGALPLALVLGLRQRRHRQPGRSRDGQGPLGHPRRDPAEERHQPRRPLRLHRTRARRRTRRSPSWTYGETQLIFEVRGLPSKKYLHAEASATSSTWKAGTIVGDQVLPQGEATRPRRCPRSTVHAQAADRGGEPFRATSSPPSAAATSRGPQRPHSGRPLLGGARATWPTSRIAWASRCRSTRRTKAFGDNKEAYETLTRMRGAPEPGATA